MKGSSARPKDRKATIVAAAAELFADRGFAAVGIDEIGERVGVTGPAIYRHFANKDALLAAVLEQMLEGFDRHVEAAASAAGGGLDAFVRASVRHILDHPAETLTYLRERRAVVSGSSTSPVRPAEQRVRRAWLAAQRGVVPGIDAVRSRMRQYAVVGAAAAGARSHHNVSRSRLEELLIASAIGVATTPPVEDRPEQPTVRTSSGTWAVMPSKRDEILAAALPLFRERGVSGVGIDEIGTAAGISGPSVYHWYSSKSAIVLDAYDRAGERVAAGVHEALRSSTSADDALDRLVASYVAVAADNIDLIVVTSRESGSLPESDRARLSRRGAIVRDSWVGALRAVRADLTEAEARLLVRTVYPLLNQAIGVAGGHGVLRAEAAALAGAHLRSK